MHLWYLVVWRAGVVIAPAISSHVTTVPVRLIGGICWLVRTDCTRCVCLLWLAALYWRQGTFHPLSLEHTVVFRVVLLTEAQQVQQPLTRSTMSETHTDAVEREQAENTEVMVDVFLQVVGSCKHSSSYSRLVSTRRSVWLFCLVSSPAGQSCEETWRASLRGERPLLAIQHRGTCSG